MRQHRWKSPIVWTSFAALILLILQNYGLLGYLGLNTDSYNEIFGAALTFLIAAGVLNNPTDKESF